MEGLITMRSEEMARLSLLFERIERGLERLSCQSRPMLNGERYINDRELCERLKVSERTTQEWRNNGKISYVQIGDKGKVLYAESEIEQLLSAHLKPAWRE